jgi:hypothetical protein
MASQALNRVESEPFGEVEYELSKAPMGFAQVYSGPLLPPSLCAVPAFPKLADGLKISRTEALAAAKGALAALGLEGAAALVFFGIWQLLR